MLWLGHCLFLEENWVGGLFVKKNCVDVVVGVCDSDSVKLWLRLWLGSFFKG